MLLPIIYKKMLFFDVFHLDSQGLFVPLHRKECLLWKKK